MNTENQLTAIAAAVLLVFAGIAGAAGTVAAQSTGNVAIGVEQAGNTGDAVVTVTEDGTAVEGATVAVAPIGEETYAGSGEYETDASGTVTLPVPEETVELTVAAATETGSAETTVELLALEDSLDVSVDQNSDSTATVTVTQYGDPVSDAAVEVTSEGTYAGTGSYRTGADGTVSLPAPAESSTVTVTATSGDLTDETTAELTKQTFANFGQRVSFFVHGLLDGTDSEGGIGQYVSEFVKKNNPSNDKKPDHAGGPDKANKGKPEQAGGPDKANKGKPEQAGGAEKKDNGKPEQAGGPDKANEDTSDDTGSDAEQDDETRDEETAASEETDTRGNGPGSDGHPGNGNGNGKR